MISKCPFSYCASAPLGGGDAAVLAAGFLAAAFLGVCFFYAAVLAFGLGAAFGFAALGLAEALGGIFDLKKKT